MIKSIRKRYQEVIVILKYEEVAKKIQEYIRINDLKQGDKLPILDDMTRQFDVSKSTIIKALDILESRGKIFQVRGSGIFVRRHRRDGHVNLLEAQGFKNDMPHYDLHSTVLALEVVKPDKKIQEQLQVKPEDDIYYIKRIRYVDGESFCIEQSWYKKSVVTYLNEQIVEESIFNYISKALNLSIGFADLVVELDVLNKEEADIFGTHEHDACLMLKSIYHLHNGEVFDYSEIKYRKDKTKFFMQSNNFY